MTKHIDMKKLFTTIICAAFAVVSFAQSSNLFNMKSADDADKVLKVIASELKLEGESFTKVREILVKSAESQAELAARKEFATPDMQAAIVTRQTAHIDVNLKGVLTEAQYQTYLTSKEKMQVALAKLNGK
jgi:hypothetical protein